MNFFAHMNDLLSLSSSSYTKAGHCLQMLSELDQLLLSQTSSDSESVTGVEWAVAIA